MDTQKQPVSDWATDFDHTHQDWGQNAPAIWDELREGCPVAHTERFGGAWLPTRHEDIAAIARDTQNYTSNGVVVGENRAEIEMAPMGYAPPITSDPPFHQIARRILLPPFAPKAIEALEPYTREYCHELIDALVAKDGSVDAAEGYSQNIPVRIIAKMLGLPETDGDKFRRFIHNVIEAPSADRVIPEQETMEYYLTGHIINRRQNPRSQEQGGDLIDYLVQADIEGMPLADEHVFGSIALLIIAGIDTTWSSIGAAIWHLAQNPQDLARLREDPESRPFAIEEFLRFYAPVTMARIVAEDHELRGCPAKRGDWLLLPFPAANRDPEMFEDADKFIIDRQSNRHAAFGLGIHRCLGSNLARMELSVALDVWIDRIHEFELVDPESVRWSPGQIRGPKELPIRIGASVTRS